MSTTVQLAGKQISRSPRRVLAILLAALLSSMAITATGTFIESLNESLRNELAAPAANADAVVASPADSTLAELEANPEVEAIEQLYSGFGSTSQDGRETWLEIQHVPETESLRWTTLVEGDWPSTSEVVLTQNTLDTLQLGVGDTIAVSISTTDAGEIREFTISGVVELAPGAEGTTSVMYVSAAEAPEIAIASDLILQLAEGADASGFVAELNESFGGEEGAAEALTTQEYVAKIVDQLAGGTDLLATLFLIFVVIALLAASMVIRNTFQVLLAQRLRENGLLRLVGATGSQVQRTVLAEALLLGLAGGLAGLLAGLILGWSVGALAGITTAGLPVPWLWMASALVVTVALTLVSAWAPARGASRLSPMAALSASATTEDAVAKRKIGSWITGGVLTLIGIAGAVASATSTNFLLLVPSGVVLAIGLIILVPLLVTVIMPVIARLSSGAGTVAKLAGENLVRTSRRTGTVVLAIALGGSLVIAMLTALQSASASMQTMLTEDYPVDLVVATSDGGEIPSDALTALEGSEATSSVAAVRSVAIESTSDAITVGAVAAAPNEWNGDLVESISGSEILVPTWMAPEDSGIDGSTVEIAAANGGLVSLTVRASPLADSIQNEMGGQILGIVSESTLEQLGGAASPTHAWVIAADGKSSDLLEEVSDLQDTHATLDSYGALTTIQIYEEVFAMVTSFVIGMLGLTVVISAIGLASVVALAVAERGREIALLRALGLTRGKTRRMILFESVSLAGVGAILSLVIGIPLGIAATMSAIGSSTVVISLPWLGIAAVVVIAAALGIIAGLGPAQRASRIAPAQGLAND